MKRRRNPDRRPAPFATSSSSLEFLARWRRGLIKFPFATPERQIVTACPANKVACPARPRRPA